MAIPTVIGTGALTASVDAITPALPGSLVTDDLLVLAVGSGAPATLLTIANAAGGTWTAAGPFNGSNANSGVRLTVFTSRYNGTQTAPTTNDVGDHQMGQIVAVRGCDYSSGSAVNVVLGDAPTFAETVSSILAQTSTVGNGLVLDIIAGDGPDSDSTGLYSGWTNATLGSLTEIADASSSVGTGGSLAINTGTKAAAGDTGITTVTHASFRVAYKKLVLIGTPSGFSVDVSVTPNRATVGGVTFFPRIFYDSGGSTNFGDSSVAALDLGRFGMTHYLNYQYGAPYQKAVSQLTPLAALGMWGLATGNAFGTATVDEMSAGNGTFAVVANTLSPTVPFRTLFPTLAGAGGVYLADEINVSVLSNLLQWRTTYHADMPTLPTLVVLLPEGPLTPETSPGSGIESQHGSAGFTEHLLSVGNPYWWMRNMPAGGNDWLAEDPYPIFRPESTPGASGGVLEQGGYPHYWVADRAAHTVAAASQNGKVPILILQLFTGLFGGRFPTPNEQWQHVTMAVAEGIRGLGWWQIGGAGGIRDQAEPTRTNAENALITITQFLKANEATILSTPVTSGWTNSTRSGTALAWRKAILPTIASAIRQTSDGDGGRGSYQAELNALNAGVTQWSPMLDQNGHVRMRVFQKTSSSYLVFAYNYHPSVSGAVTFTAPSTIRTVTVVGESRTVAPTGATFTDTFGGSSSANATSTQAAHIFEVTLGTSPPSVPAHGPFIVKLGRY